MRDQIEAALRQAQEQDAGADDKPTGKGKDGKKEKAPSVATQLVELASDAELFHDDAFECFARVEVGDHHETMRVRSQMFKRWLLRQFFIVADGAAPSNEAISSAINTLEAQASFMGDRRQVAVRIAGADGAVYVDLGTPDWDIAEITAAGWKLRNDAPVALYRPPGLKPLPIPDHHGDIRRLREFLNVDEAGWTMAVSWLVGAFKPTGPYPVLTFQGEQGTGKTSAGRKLRALIDPNVSPMRTTPKTEHDLVITASNGWVIALDNLSQTQLWLSDAICRLATGGGFATKTLYTDRDEQLFDAVRPVILNGIDSIVTRHDLADRCLFCTLHPIPEEERIAESDLDKDFAEAAPAILGGLFDAVSMALRNIETVSMEKLPRMADFALWVKAAEPALPWPAGQFETVYTTNRKGAVERSIESSLLGTAILQFAETNASWEGTPSDLLANLERLAGEKAIKAKAWPKSPSAFSRHLRELSSFLRKVGVEMELDNRVSGKRLIKISKTHAT